MGDSDTEEYEEIKFHLEQAKMKMEHLKEKKQLNEAVLAVLDKGLSKEQAVEEFKVPYIKLHEAVSKRQELGKTNPLKEAGSNKVGKIGEVVEEVERQLETHTNAQSGSDYPRHEEKQKDTTVNSITSSDQESKVGRRTKRKNVMSIRRVKPEEIEESLSHDEEVARENEEYLTCDNKSEMSDPMFVLPDEDIICVQESQEHRTTNRKPRKPPKRTRTVKERQVVVKSTRTTRKTSAKQGKQRKTRNSRKSPNNQGNIRTTSKTVRQKKKQKSRDSGQKSVKRVKKKKGKNYIHRTIREMDTAVELVKAYNMPHPLVAKKFNLSVKELVKNITHPAQTELAQNEALERIVKTQRENAMHWIPKAIKEGYVSLRTLFRYEKFGASAETIQECLTNMDKDAYGDTSKGQPSKKGQKRYTIDVLPKGIHKAYCAIRDDDMPMKTASKEFNIPLKTLQSIEDGKIEVRGLVHIKLNPVFRKFKDGGKDLLKNMQPDSSKHWILDSLEQGKIFLKDAADLYGVEAESFQKVIYSIEEDELRNQWRKRDVLKAVKAYQNSDMTIEEVALKFKVSEKVVRYAASKSKGRVNLRKTERMKLEGVPVAKYKKRYECSVMQIALRDIKLGKTDVKCGSEKYGIEESTLQGLVDGTLRIETWLYPKPIPRKFLPGVKERLIEKYHPDGSKNWVLDSIEDGSLTANEAATVFGISKTAFGKKLFTIDELRVEWTEEDLEKAIHEVKTNKTGFTAASNKYKVPRDLLWSRIKGDGRNLWSNNSQRALPVKQEEELKNWLLDKHSKGEKVSTNDIFTKARTLRAEGSGDTYANWEKWMYPNRSFKHWLINFRKRHKELTAVMDQVRKRTRRTKKELAVFKETLKKRDQEEKQSSENVMPEDAEENENAGVLMPKQAEENCSAEDVLQEKTTESCNSRKRRNDNDSDQNSVSKKQRENTAIRVEERESRLSKGEPEQINTLVSDANPLQGISEFLLPNESVELPMRHSTDNDEETEDATELSTGKHTEGNSVCTSNSRETEDNASLLRSLRNAVMDTHVNQVGCCANCGDVYNLQSSSSDVWVRCAATGGGCGALFHVKCIDQHDISYKELQLPTWKCSACVAVQSSF